MSLVELPKWARRTKVVDEDLRSFDPRPGAVNRLAPGESLRDVTARAEAAIANTVKTEFSKSARPRPATQIAADIDANDVDEQLTERRLTDIRANGIALRDELAKSLEAIDQHTEILRQQYLGGSELPTANDVRGILKEESHEGDQAQPPRAIPASVE